MKNPAQIHKLLVLRCLECDAKPVEVPFSDHDAMVDALWRAGEWLLSVVTARLGGDLAFAPICKECAFRIHGPEVVADVRRQLEKRGKK